MTETQTLLWEMSAATGVSGREEAISAYIQAYLEPYGRCYTTPLGSLVCQLSPVTENGTHLMVCAHMDEIGFVVTHIGEDGFLQISNVGGIDRKLMTAACVWVHGREGDLPGVICSTPPHLQKGDSKDIPPIDELYIDLGLPQEQVRAKVRLGDRVTFDTAPALLVDGCVSAKAQDDRACCAAVMLAGRALAQQQLNCGVSLVFSTMEEVGSQGAQTAANALAPTHAVVLDVSFAHSPDAEARKCGKLKAGPMLGIAPILDNGVTDRLMQLAEEQKIPLQYEVMNGSTGTDADDIAVSGRGVRTGLLSIPQRYMHTPIETIAPEDVEQTAKLLAAYISDLSAKEVL